MRSYYNGVYRLSFKRKKQFYAFGTMACAWHRQVRLAALAAAKHTYAPQAAQQKKGAAERSRPGLTA